MVHEKNVQINYILCLIRGCLYLIKDFFRAIRFVNILSFNPLPG